MGNFFSISFTGINLFSFMCGVAFVAMSSLYGGRTFATRLSLGYFAGLALWFALQNNSLLTQIAHNTASTPASVPAPVVVEPKTEVVPPKTPVKDRKNLPAKESFVQH